MPGRRPRLTSSPPRVALLLESSTSWGALALRGIADYVREHGRWSIFVEPRGWYERLRLPRRWRGDGIIGRITSPTMAREIEATGLPAINLSYLPLRSSRMIQLTTGETRLARLGAEHFRGRGFRHFAYCGPVRYPHYLDRMGPAFAAAVGEAGHACASYAQGESPKVSRNWLAQQRRLGAWLGRLPRPLAVFTWNSERGRQVIDACAAVGLRVPDDVAVLAADNDEVTCELSDPPLSAIDHGPRRIGHAAAELLDRLMRGDAPPQEPVLFAPAGVVSRQSTDVLAVEDDDVAAALRFILRHATEPIGVEDVVKATRLSRRMLELRFARRLGRSPAAEIRRLRTERAQRLLADTSLTVAEIAEASGFRHAEVMNRIFRREMSTTPTLYRRQMRA